jgi:hypothetical protein
MSIPISPYIRYKADDFDNQTKIWNQSIDSTSTKVNISISINSNIIKTQNTVGYGVNKQFNVVEGTALSQNIIISSTNIPNYTLFSVARYNGINKQRIITTYGPTDNGLYGFHNLKNGVAFHNTEWITRQTSFTNTDNWILSTDYAYNYRCNGIPLVINPMKGITYLPPISINGYPTSPTNLENSDYQVADIIIYNRQLTFSEIIKIEKYLFNLYGFNGYYYNNTNLYSLYMPKLTDPYSNVNNTNFLLNGVDLSNNFQKKISVSGNSSYYITNTSDIGSLFQDVSTCIFTFDISSVSLTSSTLDITINGTNLNYVKNVIIFLNTTFSSMTINNIGGSQYTKIFTTTSISTLTTNTSYSFALYFFDSSNQYYDCSYTSSFYTYPTAPTITLACDETNVISATFSGGSYNSSSIEYYYNSVSSTSTYTSSLYNSSVSLYVRVYNNNKTYYVNSSTLSIITNPSAPTITLSCDETTNVITVSLNGGSYNSSSIEYYYNDVKSSTSTYQSTPNTRVNVYVKVYNSDRSKNIFSSSQYITSYPSLTFTLDCNIYNIIAVSLTGGSYLTSYVYYSYNGGQSYINPSMYLSTPNTNVNVWVKVYNFDSSLYKIFTNSITTNPSLPTISLNCSTSNLITVSLTGGSYLTSDVNYSYDGGQNYVKQSTYQSTYNTTVYVIVVVYNSIYTKSQSSTVRTIVTYPSIPTFTLSLSSSKVISVLLSGGSYTSVKYYYEYEGGLGNTDYITSNPYTSIYYNITVGVIVRVYNSDNTFYNQTTSKPITTDGTKPTITVDTTLAYNIKDDKINLIISYPYQPYPLTIISPTFTNNKYTLEYLGATSLTLTVITEDKNKNRYNNSVRIRKETNNSTYTTPSYSNILYVLIGGGGKGGKGPANTNAYSSPGGGGGGGGTGLYGFLNNITSIKVGVDVSSGGSDTILYYNGIDTNNITASHGLNGNGQLGGTSPRPSLPNNTYFLPSDDYNYTAAGKGGNGHTNAGKGADGNEIGDGGNGGNSDGNDGGGGGGGGRGYFASFLINPANGGGGGYGGEGGSNGVGFGGGGGGGGGYGGYGNNDGADGANGNRGYALIVSYYID